MSGYLAARTAENLARWHASGESRRWVENCAGCWDHAAWEKLIGCLEGSEFWPLDSAALGRLLEEIRQERQNLQRWIESGQPRRWVAAQAGRWQHGDWLALLGQLRYSEFWPLDPAALGATLERLALEWRNLRRWQDSGDPHRWVEQHQASWDHHDWLALLDTLRRSGFWPLDPAAVGELLEQYKLGHVNVQRWRDSGQARDYVQAHPRPLTHAERLSLFDTLSRSEYWPVDAAALERVLGELQGEAQNLRRWEESGEALAWVEEKGGQWSAGQWQELVADLRQSTYWPLDIQALAERLQQVRQEWWNLDRWKVSGLARCWVEAHQGDWTADDWHALLDDLRAYHFWPVDASALAQVLNEVRADWWRLRPWLQSGQQLRHPESGHGRAELRQLLDALHRADFWPAERRPVREVESRQAA